MSAYGHQMDGEHSNQSLSSRDGSRMGSHFILESGFYMRSFAATIFVAGLVTVGVLLITLLIALTVMLHSCESRNAGLVDMSKPSDGYNYCKILSLQAELNGLDVDDLPEICKTAIIQYIKQGQYARDLNLTVAIAEHYFDSVKPLEGGMGMVLIDIDDFFPSSSHYTDPLQSRFSQFGCYDCIKEANNLKHFFILKLYIRLCAGGWPLILLSRRPEKQRNDTINNLIYAGYGGWSSLIMRLDDEMQMDAREYFSRLRSKLQMQGVHITAVISCRMDALTGLYSGKRVFKFPNPVYQNLGKYSLRMNLPLPK